MKYAFFHNILNDLFKLIFLKYNNNIFYKYFFKLFYLYYKWNKNIF